jgi:putative ABC transport system permease protein
VTKTTTEAAFQAIFVAMLGNLPFFVGTIGGAVVFAVLFSVVNTMLMAGRQRTPEVGILKALGFPDGAVSRLMMCESVLLSMTGGLLGIGLAVATQEPLRQVLGQNFPGYKITPVTIGIGLGVSLGIGIIAGIGPAIMTARLKPTDALRSEG